MRHFRLSREDIMRAYVPKGALKVRDRHSDAVAYVATVSSPTGKPQFTADIYFGKQTRPVDHSSWKTEAKRNERVRLMFEARQRSLAAKQDIRAKQNAPNELTVDTVLYTSWGYDQTQVDFYQVIEVKGQHVTVRKIRGKPAVTEPARTGSDSGHCTFDKNNFCGKPMRKRVMYGNKLTIDGHSATIDEGKPHYWSSYH